MPILTRIQSGLLQEDHFDSPALDAEWSTGLIDLAQIDLTTRPGFLQITPGAGSAYLLRPEPAERYVVEVVLDYAPAVPDDQGGIAIYRAETEKLELVSYYDAARPGPWVGLRLFCNGSSYAGYASPDGKTWSLVGQERLFGSKQIGLCLGAKGNAIMAVDRWLTAADRYLVVGNLIPGMRIELLDDAGSLVDSATCPGDDDRVFIDMIRREWPFRGQLRVIGTGGNEIYTTPVDDLWPGDRFWYDVALEIQRNGTALPLDAITHLGSLQNGFLELQLSVVNRDTEEVRNLLLGIQQYQEHRGYEWVKLAPDNFGLPGAYSDTLHIPVLPPGGVQYFWLRVDRQSIPIAEAFEDYVFRLVVRN